MFRVSDLRKTTFYQEVKEEVKQEVEQETKLKSVSRLLAIGLTPEQIAQALDLSVEVVRQVVREDNSGS